MSNHLRTLNERIEAAAERIREHVVYTPLERSPACSELLQADVYFKLENLQTTGSFKLRGATNRVLCLSAKERERGVVAASSGNHGAAVAAALQKLEARGIIFVPEQTASVKQDAIRQNGGEIQLHGVDGLDTEQHARQYADDNGMLYLSPYNDIDVIAGQGTCGLEIIEQLPDIDDVFIAVGGGGLISGVACAVKRHNPAARIYGCQPSASAVMAHSLKAGKILDLPSQPTLSDGTAGGIEPGAITLGLVQELVDEFVLVDETEIEAAMQLYARRVAPHQIEGAAGVAVAGLLARKTALLGRKIAVIICGGNIEAERFARITAAAA